MNILLIYILLNIFFIGNSFIYNQNCRVLKKSLPFEDCASQFSMVYLDISGCTKLPCLFERGTQSIVNIEFRDPNNDTRFLKHSVHWIFNMIKTRAYIRPDPCDDHEDCIFGVNENKCYWTVIHVNQTLPVLKGRIIWQAFNHRNESMICFKIPVIIK